MRARSVGVDRGWLGSQAFNGAAAFNANIGAWNTAAVTTLSYVCAALFGPGGAPPQAGRARRVVDAARAVAKTRYLIMYSYVYACIYIFMCALYIYM